MFTAQLPTYVHVESISQYTLITGHTLIPASEVIQSRLTRSTTHVPCEFTDWERIGLSLIAGPCGELKLCSPVGYIKQDVSLDINLLFNTKQHNVLNGKLIRYKGIAKRKEPQP